MDAPLLSKYAALDAFIDVFEVGEKFFLHTSPEYAMKRQISLIPVDCYFLGHVFRVEELGRLHNHEFTMIEYYRIHKDLPFLIEETLEIISLFTGEQKTTYMNYEEAFLHFAGIPDIQNLTGFIDEPHLSAQEKMHLAFATLVEPKMEGLVVIDGFPASEAALAKIKEGIAQRFEIYFNGIELANGYDELLSSREQRERFLIANEKRKAMGKKGYALDEDFLACLDKMPECVGVAIGFDRLLQIKLRAPSLHDVIFH